MRKLLVAAGIPALYLLLFAAMTWPLAARCTTACAYVPNSDAYQFLWNTWHLRAAVLGGQNPLFTDYLFYPTGSWLIMHGYTPVFGIANLLLNNNFLALNAVTALSFALSGAGAYRLARRWVAHPVLCLLVGVFFAFSPYKLQRLPEHYNLLLTATVPYYIDAFLRAFAFAEGRPWLRVSSWKHVLYCGILGVVTLLSDYYVLFGLLYFSAAYAAWFWLRLGRLDWQRGRTWGLLVVFLAVSHVALRLLRLSGADDNAGFFWGGDVVAYFLPPPTSRWLAFDWATRLYNNGQVFTMPGSLEITLFLGYLLLLLGAAVWLWPRRPPSARHRSPAGRPLAWVLLFFVLLTVPGLRILGHERLNLPTAVLHFVPFFNNLRCPTRWVMFVSLLLPIVTFSAAEAAWASHGPRRAHTALALLLLAGVLVEFWPRPYQLATAALVPPAYRLAARLPGRTLIPIPLAVADGYHHLGQGERDQLFFQTVHHKKMPIGYLSRVAPALFDSLRRQPVLGFLLSAQEHPDSLGTPPTPPQVAAFARRYQPAAFVISPAWRGSAAHRQVQALFPGFEEVVFADGYVLLRPRQ